MPARGQVWSNIRQRWTYRPEWSYDYGDHWAEVRFSASDRIELRRQFEEAVELMREADSSSARFVRTRLAREALAKAIVASAAARELALDPSQVSWPSTDEAIRWLGGQSRSDQDRSAIALVTGDDVLTDAEYRLLADLFAKVERQVDLRSPRDLLMTRGLRRLGLVLVLVTGAWIASRPTNLARGKIVTSSSTCPDMPIAPLGAPGLERVVDGLRTENTFAICTNFEQGPWVTVDLGSPRSIRRIVVYPQTVGPWGKTDIPQQIRVSFDNEHFETVGARNAPYTVDFPWRLESLATRAQYVQLIGTHGPQKLVLNEIEVYEAL